MPAAGLSDADFYDRSRLDPGQSFAELRRTVETEIADLPLRSLVVGLLDTHAETLKRLPASEAPDLRPRQLPDIKLAFPFDREAGPVMVLIEYRVPLANAAAFVQAMEEVGHVRKRDGAWRWHLFQDTADAEHWYEAFTVASWLDYLRQRRRGTAADEVVLQHARRFLYPGFAPLVRRMIARGRDLTVASGT